MGSVNRAQAVKFLLQLLLDGKKQNTVRIRFEAPAKAKSEQVITFYSLDPNTKAQVAAKTFSMEIAEVEQLVLCLSERTFFWPDRGDNLFETNTQQVKRLLFAPLSPFRLLADYSLSSRSEGQSHSVLLDNILWTEIAPITDNLMLNDVNKQAILLAAKSKSGLVLTSKTIEPGVISAAAIILALRPDAVYYHDSSTNPLVKEALSLAADHLVVVAVEGSDPVDLTYSFISAFAPQLDLFADCCKKLRLSIVHRRVKRTCGACARSTPVSSATIERLPAILRPLAKDTYMFSRGCDKCGNTAYRGTVGLDSVLGITEDLREILAEGTSAEVFSHVAYAKGTRPLMEDGLRKIYTGLTSFEEVFRVCKNISPAFALAATRAASVAVKEVEKAEDESRELASQIAPMQTGLVEDRHVVQKKNRQVLIVEDEIDQRDVLQVVFEKEGFDVLGADNGKHALEMLKQQRVDIVICDIMMPVMNGFDFVKILRETTSFRKLPILMLTAVENSEDECTLLSLGADDYCAKNVKKKILLQRVERLLERKKKDNPVEHLLKDDE
jgi:CheY-like chemotaxis protein